MLRWLSISTPGRLERLFYAARNGRFGSLFPVHRDSQLRPDLGAYRKESGRFRTLRMESPKLKTKQACLGRGR